MYVFILSYAASSLPPDEANMKVITAIYLNCRPDLRDEWLTGNEIEEGQGAQVSWLQAFLTLMFIKLQAQEQALRHLVKFCA